MTTKTKTIIRQIPLLLLHPLKTKTKTGFNFIKINWSLRTKNRIKHIHPIVTHNNNTIPIENTVPSCSNNTITVQLTSRLLDDEEDEDVSIKEYIYICNSDKVIFGAKHKCVQNLAITYAFKNEYGSPKPEKWHGKNWKIATLCRRFKIPKSKSRQIFTLLKEFWRCKKARISYPDPNKYVRGRPGLIDAGSEEKVIIVDWMEQCLGFRYTLKMANNSRTNRGIFHIDRSVVITTFRCMAPVITKIRKWMQGSTTNKDW